MKFLYIYFYLKKIRNIFGNGHKHTQYSCWLHDVMNSTWTDVGSISFSPGFSVRLIEPKKNERGKQLYFGDTFFTGDYWITHFGGIKQCNLYGRFGGFTSTGAVFGLVICPCFTTWNSEYFPENQRMSPENWWLEDNIPFKMVPFFRGHLSFQGCSLCYTSTFAQIKPLEQ